MEIRLEHDLADARAREPLGFEALQLHCGLRGPIADLAVVHGVEGEQRLAALAAAHLERDGEVFKVHGRRRLQGRADADSRAVLLRDQAAHALGHLGAADLHRELRILGDPFGAPTDVELVAAGLLQRLLRRNPFLLLPPEVTEQQLGPALAMEDVPAHADARSVGVNREVALFTEGQAARAAHVHALLVQNDGVAPVGDGGALTFAGQCHVPGQLREQIRVVGRDQAARRFCLAREVGEAWPDEPRWRELA
mmetsp:Transcript_25799/g.74498  ORF Transcript_25799/g.74498 Transcript_25799/m.74498 type:complete len:252 (+) Transcript_25799:2061-2816(+)